MTELAIELIQSVGYPIVVSAWFLFRLENTLKSNTAAIIALKDALKK